MALLTQGEIEVRIGALAAAKQATFADAERALTAGFSYVRPLVDAADSVIDSIENTTNRFMLGLEPIDFRTRGFGAKELVLITGFAHAGKTQLLNTAILNSRDKRVLFFSMDDPAEMILLKLVCMYESVGAEALERAVRAGDADAKLTIRQAATQVFDNLSVVDDSIGLDGMDTAIGEYERLHGGPPQCVIIDYVGSMQHGGDSDDGAAIKQKMASLKRWVKDKDFPTIVAHQNTRSNGGPGAPVSMLSGGYGGEAEATFVIGVRRKRDWEDLEPSMRQHHRDTVTLHLVKNKRPPGKKTPSEGVDFFMDEITGLIRVLRDEDVGLRTHDQAMAARRDID